MFLPKLLKCFAAGVLVAGLGVGFILNGIGSEVRAEKPVATEKPAKPEGEKSAAEKPPIGDIVQGTIKSVDDKKKTVTLVVALKNGTKEVKEMTYPLGNETKIILDHGAKKNETKPGTIAHLTEGTPVTAQLTVDGKSVAKINVSGGSLQSAIKSVDITKKTITVTIKDKDKGKTEKTITLMDDAKIILDDGMGDKKKPVEPKEGKLADLVEGTRVNVQLCGFDRTQAVAVIASGPSIGGTVGGVDVGNSTITIQVKEDGAVVDKTFKVHKDARINDGKALGDIQQGKKANLRLSIEDQKTVVGIQVGE